MYHYRIAAKYLQAASCALQSQQYSLGKDYVQRAEETMARNGHVAFSEYERETVRHFRGMLEQAEAP